MVVVVVGVVEVVEQAGIELVLELQPLVVELMVLVLVVDVLVLEFVALADVVNVVG